MGNLCDMLFYLDILINHMAIKNNSRHKLYNALNTALNVNTALQHRR